MELKKSIRNYLQRDIGRREEAFADDASLYDLGILDSLKMIQFVLFLQSEFKIAVDPSVMNVEDFETVDSIAAFVRKNSKAGNGDV